MRNLRSIKKTALILAVGCFICVNSFVLPVSRFGKTHNHATHRFVATLDDAMENIKEDLSKVSRIVQKSRQEGADFKQTLANVLAGDYDTQQVKSNVEACIISSPCVVFTWQNSPSCKKAIQALDFTGFDYTVIRLDNPWEEGNKMRAELGKMVGRTSVPMVFIGGTYVGGFDGGPNENAPGLVALAFQGKLNLMLEAAGAAARK